MNLRITQAVTFSAFILGASLFQAGCATTGNQRSADANNTMKAVEQDYMNALTQIDVTDSSLQSLIEPGQPDEMKAYHQYSANVHKMRDLGKRLFERAEQMNSQQKNYFAEWRMQGNTYTDPQIQALSEQRRADLSRVFANIAESSVGVKGSLKAYISDNEQIDTYLSTDLTPKGVESITSTAQQAIADGENLKDTVKPVLNSISTAREELAQGGNQVNPDHQSDVHGN
jgi:hypothetical protein